MAECGGGGELARLKAEIRALSEFNVTNVREIILHFQALKSARVARIMMDAPGLYYPELSLYVVSKSGGARGHATIHQSILPLIAAEKSRVYGFVLYPESYVRSCLDSLLRKTVRVVCPEMRLSVENTFNSKYHGQELTDSPMARNLLALLKADLAAYQRPPHPAPAGRGIE